MQLQLSHPKPIATPADRYSRIGATAFRFHVAGRIDNNVGVGIRQHDYLLVRKPHTMRHREPRSQQTNRLEVTHLRATVVAEKPSGSNRLGTGFVEVRCDRQRVLTRQRGHLFQQVAR